MSYDIENPMSKPITYQEEFDHFLTDEEKENLPCCVYCDTKIIGNGYRGKKVLCSSGCFRAGRAEQEE